MGDIGNNAEVDESSDLVTLVLNGDTYTDLDDDEGAPEKTAHDDVFDQTADSSCIVSIEVSLPSKGRGKLFIFEFVHHNSFYNGLKFLVVRVIQTCLAYIAIPLLELFSGFPWQSTEQLRL